MNYYISNRMIYNLRDTVVLKFNSWDDYGYHTLFDASYFDKDGNVFTLGSIKMAYRGMKVEDDISQRLQAKFTHIPEEYFSLWQSADEYETVRDWSYEYKVDIFKDLNDIAYDLNLFDQVINENVCNDSLFRYVRHTVCRNQFHRIAIGQAKLTPYSFSYIFSQNEWSPQLDFNVKPDAFPPTNIHALIGGNGVGKTTLIRDMISSICDNNSEGAFVYNDIEYDEKSEHFANIICVGFSPFDDYASIENLLYKNRHVTYIGTRKEYDSEGYEDGHSEINLLDDIENQFISSLKGCVTDSVKRRDLLEVIPILENDPVFMQHQLSTRLAGDIVDDLKSGLDKTGILFKNMSSGHKVVLSILIRCIDQIAEKTIVFVDEPENHLHPPLLSSLIRSLSHILIKRNGVCILSTHSPIVLQEIPKSCVWVIQRYGKELSCERPRYETFGENVGVLTNEVFKHEINKTGFHSMLQKSVDELNNYEEVMQAYDYQLGDEAKALVRMMFLNKERR